MTYTIEKMLPSADEVIQRLPIDADLQEKVLRDRAEIEAILEGKDPRKILVIGPCSAWPDRDVVTYAEKLKRLETHYQKELKIVMRTYLQKPRTTIGWLGPLNQIDPYAPADLEAGIYYCRSMMIEVLKLGMPMADEALFTHNDGYFVDLLSWIAIGARSSEDQEHRIFASMIPHPVGIKHPTSGDLEKGVHSIVAAQHSHVFALHRQQIHTSGNPHTHLILRGGNGKPNYQEDSIKKSIELLQKYEVKNPGVMIDLSHENSLDPLTGKKDHRRQILVLEEVLNTLKKEPAYDQFLKGFMAESFLKSGKQDLSGCQNTHELTGGLSITDPCLGWEETEILVEKLADYIRKK